MGQYYPAKTAELRAAEDRDLFHTLIEHIPDSIYFKNRESRFVLANTATANKLGVPTPADLTGRTDDYFLTNDVRYFPQGGNGHHGYRTPHPRPPSS